jgi:hypothetical protein
MGMGMGMSSIGMNSDTNSSKISAISKEMGNRQHTVNSMRAKFQNRINLSLSDIFDNPPTPAKSNENSFIEE